MALPTVRTDGSGCFAEDDQLLWDRAAHQLAVDLRLWLWTYASGLICAEHPDMPAGFNHLQQVENITWHR